MCTTTEGRFRFSQKHDYLVHFSDSFYVYISDRFNIII
ncbi:hypothetical protein RNAN_0548 [Rheinheimera nanhaiensis E407-8]|uniref:Uncharacterized protein n=1 Tax=Rheinheimera nanhaiensis E407-8 TaxID=562729 RepID=I1DU51_9GAMM|nr:hypothetical protein RNAN_0548 [Rheinheimera nanhaiensis E407-8]